MMILWMLACGGGKDGATETHWGDITADRAGESASVDVLTAYGFNSPSNGKAIVFLTGNADASCDDATNGLSGGSEDFDPSVVLPAGQCSLFFQVTYSGGSFSDSASAGSPSVDSIIAANCAMDEGDWAYEERDDWGWYYSGAYWQGSPQDYTLEVEGGDGADFTFTLDMQTWDGNFIYDNMEAAPAQGHVAGSGTASWCETFGQTSFF